MLQALFVTNGVSLKSEAVATANKNFIATVGVEPLAGDSATKDAVLETIKNDKPGLVHIFAPRAVVGKYAKTKTKTDDFIHNRLIVIYRHLSMEWNPALKQEYPERVRTQ